MRAIGPWAVLALMALIQGCTCLPACSTATGPTVVVVQGSLGTTASNGQGQRINIDGLGGLPFGKVKRYTVTIQTALLSTAPGGIDSIEVYASVLSGGAAYGVRVMRQDPATASTFPNPGLTIPPYTGTDSYITVFRGADGLGPIDVRFNAYVEIQP